MNLYNISTEMMSIKNELIENGGELTPELESKLVFTQEALQTKAASYGLVIKDMLAEIAQIEHVEKDLAEKKKNRKNAINRMKESLSKAMLQFNILKVETPMAKLSFRKSLSTEITDESLIPKDYIEIVEQKKIDKTAIKKAIQSGIDVNGAELIEKQNLQIK